MEDYERSLLDGMWVHIPDMYSIDFYRTVFRVIDPLCIVEPSHTHLAVNLLRQWHRDQVHLRTAARDCVVIEEIVPEQLRYAMPPIAR